MAGEITADLAGTDPVVLAVMHGGAFAAVEICRRLRFPYELDFVHVTRYARSTRGGEIEWRVRPSAELTGRTVLVVDDVLDRGHTLRALGAELKKVGARIEVKAHPLSIQAGAIGAAIWGAFRHQKLTSQPAGAAQ